MCMNRTKLKLKAKQLAHKLDHQNDLVTALYSWVLFLVYEVFVRAFDLYGPIPEVDIVGHFLAGIALGATFLWIGRKNHITWRNWFVVGGSIAMSLLWEAAEKIEDSVYPNPDYLIDIFFWDGVSDIIIALLGTSLYLLIKHFNKAERNEEFHEITKNRR